MAEDAGEQLKARMRTDLVAAMKAKQAGEVALLRSLLAAIDNAEAPPLRSDLGTMERGPSEIERLALTRADVDRVLTGEIADRERAAGDFESLGNGDRANALRREAAIARDYLSGAPS